MHRPEGPRPSRGWGQARSGAGRPTKKCSSIVLTVLTLLGADPDFCPKFLRRYANVNQLVAGALSGFHEDVRDQSFPAPGETYG